MIASYEAHMIFGRPESFDRFAKDALIMCHSLVESGLSKRTNCKATHSFWSHKQV